MTTVQGRTAVVPATHPCRPSSRNVLWQVTTRLSKLGARTRSNEAIFPHRADAGAAAAATNPSACKILNAFVTKLPTSLPHQRMGTLRHTHCDVTGRLLRRRVQIILFGEIFYTLKEVQVFIERW